MIIMNLEVINNLFKIASNTKRSFGNFIEFSRTIVPILEYHFRLFPQKYVSFIDDLAMNRDISNGLFFVERYVVPLLRRLYSYQREMTFFIGKCEVLRDSSGQSFR